MKIFAVQCTWLKVFVNQNRKETTVQFADNDEKDFEPTNPPETKKFLKTLTKITAFRRSRRFHPNSELDTVDIARLESKKKKIDKKQNCCGRLSGRYKAILKKIWSTTTNILLCSFDSGTDAWTARSHYMKYEIRYFQTPQPAPLG